MYVCCRHMEQKDGGSPDRSETESLLKSGSVNTKCMCGSTLTYLGKKIIIQCSYSVDLFRSKL